jgi:VanZ family protein
LNRPRRATVVAAVLWWLSILALLPTGRAIVDALRGAGLLALAVTGAFVAIAGAALAAVWRSYRRGDLSVRQIQVALVGVALVALAAQQLPRFEERWHCIQYSILGGLLWAAFAGRPHRWIGATAAVAMLGWLDEGVQFLLPDRVYDLWDVALNAVSGLAGAILMEITARAGGELRAAGKAES